MSTKIEISLSSYLRLIFLLLALFLLWQIRDVVVLLFIVFILVQALRPVVNWLKDLGVPRAWGIVIIYLVLVSILTAILSLIIPPLVEQLQLLAANAPILISKIKPLYESIPESVNLQQILQGLTDQLGNFTGNILTVASQVFGGILSVLTMFVLSFYLLMDERQIDSLIHLVVPSNLLTEVKKILEKIGAKMGGWVRGQVMLSLIIGFATLIILSILQIPYALTIATVAGVLEILPVVGPVIAAVFGTLLALTSGSWALTFATLVAFIIIQQVENNYLVPKIMQKAVGLSPVVVIVALLVGGSIAGVAGAVLAIPIAAGIDILVDEWGNLRNAFERGKN